MGTGLFLWREGGRRVKLTARLHLVLSLGINEGVPLLALMTSWREHLMLFQFLVTKYEPQAVAVFFL
jgi:hypothetical protein